jgi:hypothetical protein
VSPWGTRSCGPGPVPRPEGYGEPVEEAPETRHLHGNHVHDHPGGQVPHDHGPPPRSRAWLAWLAVCLVVAYGAVRIVSNEASHGAPPAACQLLGGSWDIWNGWRCG